MALSQDAGIARCDMVSARAVCSAGGALSVQTQIDRLANSLSNAVFLLCPETGLGITFAELKRFSERLFNHLHEKGLRKGDRVAFFWTMEFSPLSFSSG